jgi:hypothetical protein
MKGWAKLGMQIARAACACLAAWGTSAYPQAAARCDRSDPALREIDDIASGREWQLVRDANHVGGPGRWLQVQAGRHCADEGPATRIATSIDPAIRAGDRIVIDEETGSATVRIEAVALEPAALGKTLRVRLQFGGASVRAVAQAPGHATLLRSIEAWP